MCKRCYDIFLSLLILAVFLWWAIPLIALAILIVDGGPIFFVQKRTGLNGKTFFCYKFRTMIINQESDQLQASANDPRISRLGHFLRESNLDEIPQFLNVLKGQMSIVGPRPHMIHHTNTFAEVIQSYHERHLVKPGITGLAQVKGYRGPTPDYDSLYFRVHYDLQYVKNNNLLMDIQISIATAIHILKRIFSLAFGNG